MARGLLYAARQQVEIGLARLGMLVLPRCPRGALVRLASCLGSLACLCCRHSRRLGYANIDMAFGSSLTPKQKKALLRSSFRTFALVALDLFWFSRHTAQRLKQYVRLDASFDPLRESGPVICLSAHLGNWEVLGRALAAEGIPVVSVAAPLDNPKINRFFSDLRQDTGQQTVSKYGASRKLLRTLREGGKVALLLDQNTKPSEGGLFVDFFGLPVPVSAAGGALRQHTGARILFLLCIPDEQGNYPVVQAEPLDLPPVDRDDPTAVRRTTQAIASAIEERVRRHPGAWVWMYKRWKYVAPKRKREEYPFYSRHLLPEEYPFIEREEKRSATPSRGCVQAPAPPPQREPAT